MAKLYTLLDNTGIQYVARSSAVVSHNDVHSRGSNLAQIITEYPAINRSASDSIKYAVREPSAEQYDDVDPAQQIRPLLEQATALCNDLDELIALHYCFYEAVEQVHEMQQVEMGKLSRQSESKPALSVFPRWLRERDITMLDAVHTLQQSLRLAFKNSEGWVVNEETTVDVRRKSK